MSCPSWRLSKIPNGLIKSYKAPLDPQRGLSILRVDSSIKTEIYQRKALMIYRSFFSAQVTHVETGISVAGTDISANAKSLSALLLWLLKLLKIKLREAKISPRPLPLTRSFSFSPDGSLQLDDGASKIFDADTLERARIFDFPAHCRDMDILKNLTLQILVNK